MSLPKLNPPTEIIYGPVQSRRLGTSLGINLLGDTKLCSFDCPYCDLGPSLIRMNQIKKDVEFISPEKVKDELKAALNNWSLTGKPLDSITISGNGEPTLHPQFLDIVEDIIRCRNDILPDTEISVLTNGAHLDNKRVAHALNKIDKPIVKLDAGGDRVFKEINQPLVRANVSKIISGCRKLDKVYIQSIFVNGPSGNTKNEHIEEWMEVVGMIKPVQIFIYTINKEPAYNNVSPTDEDTLYTISSKLKRRSSVECLVFS